MGFSPKRLFVSKIDQDKHRKIDRSIVLTNIIDKLRRWKDGKNRDSIASFQDCRTPPEGFRRRVGLLGIYIVTSPCRSGQTHSAHIWDHFRPIQTQFPCFNFPRDHTWLSLSQADEDGIPGFLTSTFIPVRCKVPALHKLIRFAWTKLYFWDVNCTHSWGIDAGRGSSWFTLLYHRLAAKVSHSLGQSRRRLTYIKSVLPHRSHSSYFLGRFSNHRWRGKYIKSWFPSASHSTSTQRFGLSGTRRKRIVSTSAHARCTRNFTSRW